MTETMKDDGSFRREERGSIPTGSRIKWGSDPATGDWWFKGRITCDDMAELRLDPFDLAVLRQPIEGAADVLLNAEIVFRRLAEQAKARTTSTASQAQDGYEADAIGEVNQGNSNG